MADFLDYLSFRRDHILDLAIEHAQLVLYTIAIATAVSVVVGVLVYRRERLAGIVLSVVGTASRSPRWRSLLCSSLFLASGSDPLS